MIIKRNNKGMSLVEIMGAIFILSFAILAIASIFPAGLQMNRKTKIRIQALEIATGIIEELRHLPYYDPNAPCDLLDLASTNTNIPANSGWVSFSSGYGNNLGNPSWTPQVVINANAHKPESRIFFRNRSAGPRDMRLEPSTPDTIVDAANLIKIPAIQIIPLSTTEQQFPYNPTLTRCRIHKIIVTANIEEFVAGTSRYSIIQLITYRSDGLTMTPGY